MNKREDTNKRFVAGTRVVVQFGKHAGQKGEIVEHEGRIHSGRPFIPVRLDGEQEGEWVWIERKFLL